MIATRYTLLIGGLLVIVACGDKQSRIERDSATATTCSPDAARVVEQLGQRMRLVSILAPDTLAGREIAKAYGQLVAPDLLSAWQKEPATAPGRETSNPWPARIEIGEIQPVGAECSVQGVVVYVTTSDTAREVERRAVTLRLRDENGWRITAYNATAGDKPVTTAPTTAGDKRVTNATTSDTSTSPARVIRNYYEAIQARDYKAAYSLWGQRGQASGKNPAAFAAGFAQTVQVRATVSDSIRMEGAAGSQYATVPVVVDATLRDGTRQHFEGAYTLRRAMVDGATPEQRRWHIYSSDLKLR
jgi:hypothetical protein